MKGLTYKENRYIAIFLVILTLCGCASSITTRNPEQHKSVLRPDLYIWPNRNNQYNNEASLKLIVRVGSLHEEEGELGHAHFVEHMAFNGTKNFPGSEVIEQMRALDLELGQHSNAYTTFDHTSYHIELNDADDKRIESAMELLAEWSYNTDFNVSEVEQERSVILEEWRQGQTEDFRVGDAFFDDYYKDSRFIERKPIGTRSSIENATSSSLSDFYQRWYQPHNQAVIVAGDIDPEVVKAAFERYFPRRVSDGPVPSQHQTNPDAMADFLATSDDYSTQGYIDLSFYPESPMPRTSKQLVETQAWKAALDIWHQRSLSKMEQTGGSVIYIDYDWEHINQDRLMIQLSAGLSRNDFKRALNIIEGERQRLLRDGIQLSELNQWRDSFLSDERSYKDDSVELTDIMTDNYLYNWPMMGQFEAVERYEDYIPQLTPDDVRNALARLMSSPPKINIIYPSGTEQPTVAQVQAWIADIEPGQDSEPDSVVDETWSIQPARAGKVLEERDLDNDITEWTLDNGITAIYRYSDQDPGQFRYDLYGLGGLNLMNTTDAHSARLALPTMAQSGLREYSGEDLSQWLENVELEQLPYLNYFGRGMVGGGPVEHFDLSMRLLYIALTEAKVDPDSWASVLEHNQAELEQYLTHPNKPWLDMAETEILNGDPGLTSLTLEQLNQITPDYMQDIYHRYFSGAQNYRLVIVGDLNRKAARQAIDNVISALPITGQSQEASFRYYPGASESGHWSVNGSGESSAFVVLRNSRVKSENEFPEHWNWALLEKWVSEALNDQIREVDGSVYQIQASLDGTSRYQDRYTLIINFQTDPDQSDAVIKAVKTLLHQLSNEGPDIDRLASWNRNLKKDFQRDIAELDVQADRMVTAPLYNLDAVRALSLSENTALDAERLRSMLSQLIDEDATQVELVWLP